MTSIEIMSNPNYWLVGDGPAVVQTASGSEYYVHSSGLISGGTRDFTRKPLVGIARIPGGPLLSGQAIIKDLCMVISLGTVIGDTEHPLFYTSPVIDISPISERILMKKVGLPKIEMWFPGDGPIAVRTASGSEYYIDDTGLVSGGSRPIAGRELLGSAMEKDGPLWGERAVIVGLKMEIKCDDRLLFSSPVVEIIRYTKRSRKKD
jgi:hypothetical protein